MNLWAWRDRNPYYETAFQVLDIDPAADRATVRTRIAARRKRISYDAKRFPLFGEILDVPRINAAEEQLATPRTRLAAELLTHRTEPEGEDLPELTELLDLARTLSAAEDSGPHSAVDGAPRLDYRVLPRLLPSPTEETPA
ncbi:hypothetical protein GPX89_34060 [Nocardia sp. ET3-3]|uniref:Uncharacterized protein n=1 Tax=Nocardia terrae TaxID=2675851 RepID=A0A7K1V705_9NOCA|nr:hypothetical protein [Nocardia terrae]MVU82249.1 hypothetical protein [Nocardia terrae]